jgi:hypothetical protein
MISFDRSQRPNYSRDWLNIPFSFWTPIEQYGVFPRHLPPFGNSPFVPVQTLI